MVIWLINKASLMGNSSYLALLISRLVKKIFVNLVIQRGFARHLRWPGLAVLKIELKMWRRPLFVKVYRKSISYLAISYLYTLLQCFLWKIVFYMALLKCRHLFRPYFGPYQYSVNQLWLYDVFAVQTTALTDRKPQTNSSTIGHSGKYIYVWASSSEWAFDQIKWWILKGQTCGKCFLPQV